MLQAEDQIGDPAYRGEESCRVARALRQIGAADGAIAEAFGVSKSTLNVWRKHKDFSEALSTPPDLNDATVERSLVQAALGYSYEVDKIIKTPAGHVVRRQTVHNPPSGSALRFLLPARMPEVWGKKKTPKDCADYELLRVIRKIEESERAKRQRYLDKPLVEPAHRIARTMRRLSATDNEIAAALGMSLAAFEEARETDEELSAALWAGDELLYAALERAAMRIAVGYHYSEDHFICTRAGDIVHIKGPLDDEADMWWRAPSEIFSVTARLAGS